MITGDPGTPPRLAVPDFVALSPEAAEVAKTIGEVLWNDFNFEQEFPLWGITIPVVGSIGLIASVHANAGFRAAFGPGTLRNIRAVDIVSTGIRGENLDEYRAHVRVAFLIEGTDVD